MPSQNSHTFMGMQFKKTPSASRNAEAKRSQSAQASAPSVQEVDRKKSRKTQQNSVKNSSQKTRSSTANSTARSRVKQKQQSIEQRQPKDLAKKASFSRTGACLSTPSSPASKSSAPKSSKSQKVPKSFSASRSSWASKKKTASAPSPSSASTATVKASTPSDSKKLLKTHQSVFRKSIDRSAKNLPRNKASSSITGKTDSRTSATSSSSRFSKKPATSSSLTPTTAPKGSFITVQPARSSSIRKPRHSKASQPSGRRTLVSSSRAPFTRKQQLEKNNLLKNPLDHVRKPILKWLSSEALTAIEIWQRLSLPEVTKQQLRTFLILLEKEGEIARVRRNRYIVAKQVELVTGTISFAVSGHAQVVSSSGEVLFIRAENTGTAFHQDRVVVRYHQPSMISDDFSPPAQSLRQEGRVIRILERASSTIVGTLQKSKQFFFVIGHDPRFIHNIYVPQPEASLKASVGDQVVVALEEWISKHNNPEGKVIEVLGGADPQTDLKVIIKKYDFPMGFPGEVQAEAKVFPAPTAELLAGGQREDHRQGLVFTIDPVDAKDFDDAIEVHATSEGWDLSIHIADVSHYVRPGTALDREAYLRGNSVYLINTVIPMLPEQLSNDLCSLKPQVDRCAFAVLATLDHQGHLKTVRFAKTLIRSAVRLTYQQAYELLKSPPQDALGQSLHSAWKLASLLRKKRFQAGALNLEFPEVKVVLNADGYPIRLERVENDASHQLIEEFMLLANELVARELSLAQHPAIYRIHESPDPEKLAEYQAIVASIGIKVGDLTQPREMQKLLQALQGQPYEHAMKVALLRSLQRACYSPKALGHYGLSKTHYAHFTSPIRRYADLLLHRALESKLHLHSDVSLQGKKKKESEVPQEGLILPKITQHLESKKKAAVCPKSIEGMAAIQNLSALADHLSSTEAHATEAEREYLQLKKLQFFQNQLHTHKKQAFAATILEIRNFGFFVELTDYLFSGLVHVSALDNDFYAYDPIARRLIGQRTKKKYQTGQSLKVQVVRVDLFKKQIDFRPCG